MILSDEAGNRYELECVGQIAMRHGSWRMAMPSEVWMNGESCYRLVLVPEPEPVYPKELDND